MKNLTTIILLALVFTGCNNRLYTDNEVRQFEKGDTVYIRVINEFTPCIIIKNDTVTNIVTIKRPNLFDGGYDDFWMEECHKYKKF